MAGKDEFGQYDDEDERADDWAKEDCACGHRRSAHGRGACSRTVEGRDLDSLPKPEYAPDDEDHPFAWPANWPPLADVPLVTKPCPCTEFHDPEPSEPEDV
jgi:hypothetical protein